MAQPESLSSPLILSLRLPEKKSLAGGNMLQALLPNHTQGDDDIQLAWSQHHQATQIDAIIQ